MVALSSITGSGAAAGSSCSYEWGLPKFAKGMPFTDPCSTTIYCVCCNAYCAHSLIGCTTQVTPPQLWPLGDNCFLVAQISKWGVYGQVFSIAADGSSSAMGNYQCIHDWAYACHCNFTSCNCYTSTNLCCVSTTMTSVWANTDADGRLYIQQAHGAGGNESIYPNNLYRCVHVHQKCWDSAACSWVSQCTYSNGNFDAPRDQIDLAASSLLNIRKGVVLAKACWCNCNNRGKHYQFVNGVRSSLQDMSCNSLTDGTVCAHSFIYRTGVCNFTLIPAYGACYRGAQYTVNMTTCTTTRTRDFDRNFCLPYGGGCFNCGKWPNAGVNPQSGTSINFVSSVLTCFCTDGYCLDNYYINNSGCIINEIMASTCGPTAPGCVCGRSGLFSRYFCGSNTYLCGSTGMCCQLKGYGATLKNGYVSSTCPQEGSMYDILPLTSEADYVPFTFALGSIGLIDGIRSKFGCTTCATDTILVGDKWVVQLCCGGGSPPACNYYMKNVIMGYSSEC